MRHSKLCSSKYSVRACVLSRFCCVRLFATPRTIAHQAPLSVGILQARILQWVAMPSSRGSSWTRDRTWVSCISCMAGRFFTTGPLGKPVVNTICESESCSVMSNSLWPHGLYSICIYTIYSSPCIHSLVLGCTFCSCTYHFLNAKELGSIPELGRSPGEGIGYSLQYSSLENSMDSMGSQRVGHDWATFTSHINYTHYLLPVSSC